MTTQHNDIHIRLKPEFRQKIVEYADADSRTVTSFVKAAVLEKMARMDKAEAIKKAG